ncbi:hypothetical protein ASG73_16385 [Janibacter sp. Soil728]|uniref:glycosyltransferase family 2 protein n=1 Tax=Janibacter sp. Soil728 TaxID=1736393 RepID=UPI0006F69593|nr:glycosyltransferase family A protein [Janibacter sp. Soil728]KRE35512.1 hypothetical protein ASG73_16385 [Janibacter sp. Soil728]
MSALVNIIVQHPPVPGSDAWAALTASAQSGHVEVSLLLPGEGRSRYVDVPAGVSIVDQGDLSPTQGVNLAVGLSSSDIVLVLEGETMLEGRAVEPMVELADGCAGRQWAVLDRRVDAGQGIRSASPSATPGGALLCDRETFLLLRGLDESVHTAVGLRDLTRRARDFGVPVRAVEGTDLFVTRFPSSYESSIWHEPAATLNKTYAEVDAREEIFVNLRDWAVPVSLRQPLVSVAISTRNRAGFLRDSLQSVLFQTFQDFEVVVVDDGSTDDSARHVVAELADPRITYLRQEARGISAARNLAADKSAGWFTAVHDDDDIMLPWRLEKGLATFRRGVDATYGAWVNFDEKSGELRRFLTKKDFGVALNAFSGQGPGHGTWTLPTHLIRSNRYDEGLTSSVDHNLATRLAWNGVRWRHTEDVQYLRRVHAGQISNVEAATQKAGHILTIFANTLSAGPADVAALKAAGKQLHYPKIGEGQDLFQTYGPWLPDDLVVRQAKVTGSVTQRLFELDMPPVLNYILEERDAQTGRLRTEIGEIGEISFADLVEFRRCGVPELRLTAQLRSSDEANEHALPVASASAFERLAALLRTRAPERSCLVLQTPDDGFTAPSFGEAYAAIRVAAASRFDGRVKLLGFFFADDDAALKALRWMHRQHPTVLTHLVTTGRPAPSMITLGEEG